MKLSYGMLGFIIISISLLFLKGKLEIYEVQKKGNIVRMEIVRIPENCFVTRGKFYMKLKYNNNFYTKRIPAAYCKKHRKGDKVDIKYLENQSVVLFPNENIVDQFVAIGIFILFGISSILYGLFLRKSRKHSSS